MLPRLLALAILLGCHEGRTSPDIAEAPPPGADCGASDPDPDQVVATWDGGELTWGEVEQEVGGELRSMEIEYRLGRYETATQAIDGMVSDALVRAEAEARGLTVEELLVREVEQEVQVPTDEEVAAFYPVVERHLGGATLEEAAPRLRQELLQRAQVRRYQEWVTALRVAAGTRVTLPYPELPRADIPVAAHDPVLGPDDAPVTVVEFAEFQCFYCQKALPTVKRLVAEYGDQVRVVLKDFPLAGHSRAMAAAVAAHCAGESGYYWEMYETLLQNQDALSDTDLARYAADVGADPEAFRACMDSARYEQAIRDDIALARQVGVQATPTFFINGIVLPGAQPYDRFAALVDRELAR